MIKIYFPGIEDRSSGGELITITGRYQIMETSKPELWSKRLFQISQDTLSQDGKTFMLTGFTNQGVNVKGTLIYPHIKFKRQSVEVIPEGGDGKVKWTIDMDANGLFHNGYIELSFTIYEPDASVVSGKIKAKKLP